MEGKWKKHVRGRWVRHILFEKREEVEREARILKEKGFEVKIETVKYWAHTPEYGGVQRYTHYYILKRPSISTQESKILHRKAPRITPKTPRLRR